MKKILSFMLVLAMLAMMCINVSAATDVVGYKNDANKSGVDKGIAAADFTSKTSEPSVVNATVTSENSVRYAVDLEYTAVTISIDTDAEWNVDSMMYSGETSVKVGNANPVSFEGQGTVNDVALFTVTNYSNAIVYVSAEVSSTYTTIEGAVTGAAFVEAVTPVSGQEAAATHADYTTSLTCSDWAATFATEQPDDGSLVSIASITFTFSKDAPQNP